MIIIIITMITTWFYIVPIKIPKVVECVECVLCVYSLSLILSDTT